MQYHRLWLSINIRVYIMVHGMGRIGCLFTLFLLLQPDAEEHQGGMDDCYYYDYD